MVVAIASMAVTGCGQKSAHVTVAEPGPMLGAPAEQLQGLGYLGGAADRAASVAPAAPASGDAARGDGAPLDAVWAQQKLIRDGRIEVEVESVDEAIAEIGKVAAARRALVAGSEVRLGSDGRKSGSVTLKVPAGSYDGALAGLRELGKVRSETTSTEDVTKAYTDLESRLAVKRRTQERLEALLAGRTGDLSELLQVERELERVVTEIERMVGEQRYYDQRVAVSTIVVALHEPGAVLRPNAFAPVGEALKSALGVLATSLAGLIYFGAAAIPWLVVIWVVVVLLRKVWRKRKARVAAGG